MWCWRGANEDNAVNATSSPSGAAGPSPLAAVLLASEQAANDRVGKRGSEEGTTC